MKKNSTLLAIILFYVLSVQINGQIGDGDQIPVVPYPQEVVMEKGLFDLGKTPIYMHMSGVEGNTATIITQQLMDAFLTGYEVELVSGNEDKSRLWIGIPEEGNTLMELAQKEGIVPGSDLGEEGYVLKIEKKNIYILAQGQAGAFYGVQTLKQMLRGYTGSEALPAMTIRDWPSIGFRCVMDDISRGPIPTNDYLKQQIRRYAELKINNMSFYIEHVVRTEKYPDMAPSNGGIYIEEFKELSEYAADYHIELVGNFQSLGHFEKILSLPQFRHLGATERMLDPLNPESIEFLADIYEEMAPAFSSDYFTPNLDEAWDLSRGELNGPAATLGPARIYADHVTRVDSILRSLGKKTIVWGDIILEHPEVLQMIPKDIIFGAWNYSPSESFAHFIDPIKDAGFDFCIAPGTLNSGRLIPDFNMSTTNIRNFINEGYEKGTVGVYFTVWDDGGMHFFSHDWYGVAYNAEQSWRPNHDPLEDYDIRFSKGIYGDIQNRIPTSLHALNHLTDLGPTFEMNSNVFYKTLVPERGKTVTFNPEEWEDVKKWAELAGDTLSIISIPFYDLDVAYISFTISQYKFMAFARDQLLKAADAYNKACASQRLSPLHALEELETAAEIVGDLEYRFARLMTDFEILWDMESRPYWKDRALLAYAKHARAFADQKNLLEEAIHGLRRGAFLPPPTEVRLDIRRQSGQFFQYWLLAGSFHIESFDEYPPDFLKPIGGEAEARPFPGMKFTDTTGTDRMWIKYDSPKLGEIDFKTIFEPHITAVAYAYCTIDSPLKQEVTALLGSNDGATVWCNGKEVFHIHSKRSLIPDENEILLDLEKGRNHLMIKVEQWKAGWGLSFRLKDVEVRNHKQKYYIQ